MKRLEPFKSIPIKYDYYILGICYIHNNIIEFGNGWNERFRSHELTIPKRYINSILPTGFFLTDHQSTASVHKSINHYLWSEDIHRYTGRRDEIILIGSNREDFSEATVIYKGKDTLFEQSLDGLGIKHRL